MGYAKIYDSRREVIEAVWKAKEMIEDESMVCDITVKGKADFVTKVDLNIECYLQQVLKQLFPSVLFISEEKKNDCFDESLSYWILDPVDGTTNLIHHYQHSAVSLALCEKGAITFGMVYNPFTEETFLAMKGEGAYLNGKAIRVSECSVMQEALITLGTEPYEKEMAEKNFEIFTRIFKECADIRISGSAALDLCYIACGRLEAYAERNLKPWDYAAASLILEEAGGMITNWGKAKITFGRNHLILASNGLLHDAVRRLFS